ncbi:nucleotidyltransferase family protein [Bacteroides sp. OttesenSCG-928-N06]|nr:nucleotidyltransferase family protein [Bacteroides sp. OttesenSCG-928-N06]
MSPVQKQFFTLIQSGLWGMPADETLFNNQTNWKQIYQLARMQTLLGIVFDGIQTLPSEKRPPRNLYLQWCNALVQIEDNNRLLNKELANVYALYRANKIEPILLKGQGVAQNYRNPLHRHCGDIDLYLGDHYEFANKLLRLEATSEQEEFYTHSCMKWHGVSIENHRIITSLNSPAVNRNFQKKINEWYNASSWRTLSIGECQVNVPPLEFDAAYILIHSILHFLNDGIGLRQVCDWANLLHAQREQLNHKEVADMLHRWGLTKAAKAFGVIAVNYLGLPLQDLPIPFSESDLKTGDWLLNDILQTGNFGQHDTSRAKRPKGYWSGKWYTLVRVTKRCYQLGALAPAEARWHPVMVALQSIRMQWEKLWRPRN